MVKLSTRTYIIKKACSYNRNRTQNKLVLNQGSKQRRKKIGILTVMFLMQYFCLHVILPFSKSKYETEGTCSTAKCRGRKSFDTWYHVVTCATLCPSFFPKHILKSKARHQSIQVLLSDSKELFVQIFVNVFDQNWKHVEARNQSTGNPVYFTVPWWNCQKQPPEVLHKKPVLKSCAISTGNTCAGVYFLKSCGRLDLQLY